MSNISYPNSYQAFKRAVTPNPTNRPAFQVPNNINVQVKGKGPSIQIQKNQKPSIKIETPGGVSNINTEKRMGPQVERQSSQNPVITFQSPNDRPLPTVQQPFVTPIEPDQMNPNQNLMNSHIFINKPMPQQSIFTSPAHSTPVITPITPMQQQTIQPQPKVTTQPPPPPIQSADAFNRLSLLSFVSTFEDEKSFNETDLEILGLDLKCQDPLLPMLHSVLSNAPLLDHSRYPTPESYSKINQTGNPSEKVSLFPPQTLLFIFYTYPCDPLQVQAAQELIRRQWTYDDENEEWRDPDGNPWSINQWKKIEETQEGEIV